MQGTYHKLSLYIYVLTDFYRGICTSNSCIEVHEDLDCFFTPFANAYIKICNEQTKTNNEFFGLRDFYR